MNKFKGFKVLEVLNKKEIIIKRKTISYFKDENLYIFYSYNDIGFAVKTISSNKNDGLIDIVDKATKKIKKYKGWNVKKRNSDSVLVEGEKTIFWWQKGLSTLKNEMHYKCDMIDINGNILYGIGETLEDALNDIF